MFNLGLYKEGLKRSTLLSLLFITTMMLGSVLIPIGNIISQARAIEHGWFHFHGPIIVSGFGDNITLLIAMIAFAPILTLYLFSFLNKRNSSDFYHSLPHKRETIFVSFTASILTWVLGGIWLCSAVTLAIYAFSSAYVTINLASVVLVTLGLSVGCILVIGAVLIAMSVTGSTFSNITTALLILFLPRILLTSFIAMVVQATRVVSPENFGIFGNNSHNIPFGFVMSIFDSLHFSIEEIFIQGILYTAVLGLIYLGIGLLLFKKRKSEAAQNPALNKIVQTTIRVALAFVVCIPAIAIIVHTAHTTHHRSFGSDDFLALIAIYVIALIVYFAYELITTKKLANIVKALPGLGILVLLNIVFITGITFTQNAILDRNFEVNEIESVQILSSSMWHFSGNLSYEQRRASEVKIQDEELSSILLNYLAGNIACARNERRVSQDWHITVLFKTTSGQTVRRNFFLSSNSFLEATRILSRHEEYATALLTLPKNPADIWQSGPATLSEEALWNVYETLREEVLGFDLISWQLDHLQGRGVYYGFINVVSSLGRHTYSSWYSITRYTPRTADAFIKHTNAQSFENIERILGNAVGTGFPQRYLFITIAEYRTSNNSFHVPDIDLDVAKILLDAIREQRDTPVNRDLLHYSITIDQDRFFFNSDSVELLEFFEMGQRQWGWY